MMGTTPSRGRWLRMTRRPSLSSGERGGAGRLRGAPQPRSPPPLAAAGPTRPPAQAASPAAADGPVPRPAASRESPLRALDRPTSAHDGVPVAGEVYRPRCKIFDSGDPLARALAPWPAGAFANSLDGLPLHAATREALARCAQVPSWGVLRAEGRWYLFSLTALRARPALRRRSQRSRRGRRRRRGHAQWLPLRGVLWR